MDIFDLPAYSLTKRLLTLVGVWPLQPLNQRRFRGTVVLFCFCGMLTPLTAKFINVLGRDFDVTLECLPPIMTASAVLAKYLNGVFHVEKLKDVCNRIKSDSERLKNSPDYDVLYMHAMDGRNFCIIFIASLQVVIVVYLTLPTVLIVSDSMKKNATTEKYMMYKASYIIVDIDNHYIIATIHCYLASILIILFICPLDAMYITFTQHVCAMFAVVGYQLQTIHTRAEEELNKGIAVGKDGKQIFDKHELLYQKLVLCIKEHKRALECADIVQTAFSGSLFFQISLNIVCLSITGYQAILQMSYGTINDMIRLVSWTMGQHIHLFFLHLPGQRLLNFSMQVYYDALDCIWYDYFKKAQVVYQILIMRTMEPVKLTALKVRPLNMEAFLAVTQAAVSYFTVLSSTT